MVTKPAQLTKYCKYINYLKGRNSRRVKKISLSIELRVCFKVSFHDFIHPKRLVLDQLNINSLDFNTFFGLEITCDLAHTSSLTIAFKLYLMSKKLKHAINEAVAFDKSIFAHELLLVKRIDPMLCVSNFATWKTNKALHNNDTRYIAPCYYIFHI